MIQRHLQGDWIVITPKYGTNNILIQFLDVMEAPSLPALISLEEHNSSVDQRDKEIQFEEA